MADSLIRLQQGERIITFANQSALALFLARQKIDIALAEAAETEWEPPSLTLHECRLISRLIGALSYEKDEPREVDDDGVDKSPERDRADGSVP